MLAKGAINQLSWFRGSTSVLCSWWRKMEWFKTSDKFEKSEPFGEVWTFSGGRFEDHPKFCSRGRVSMQIRAEGCVLYDSNASEGSQESVLSLERDALRVPGAPFWSLVCPKSIHSGYESADNFLRRLAFTNDVCLNDFWLTNSERMAQSKTLVTAWFLSRLRHLINGKESPVRHSQAEEFLGFFGRHHSILGHFPTRDGFKDHSTVCKSIGEEVLLSLASLIRKLQNASTVICQHHYGTASCRWWVSSALPEAIRVMWRQCNWRVRFSESGDGG